MMLSKLLSGSRLSALARAASMVAGQRQLAAFKELVVEPGTRKTGATGDDGIHGRPGFMCLEKMLGRVVVMPDCRGGMGKDK